MKYRPDRGGHAPGHLRDAFCEYFAEGSDTDAVVVGEHEQVMPLRWLIGQLWNCTDILPSEYCTVLDLLQGSTYAMAVRNLALVPR